MIDKKRLYLYNTIKEQPGCVIYWMQRDQRAQDNWALLYAQEKAIADHQPLVVVFCLVPEFSGATIRHYGFMIKGLAVTAFELAKFNIPFYLLNGFPQETLPVFLNKMKAGLLVSDFNPLHTPMDWKKKVAGLVTIPFHEIDAHNILPCRTISDKPEYAAFTIRKKVERRLPEFLIEFPALINHLSFADLPEKAGTDWSEVVRSLQVNRDVPETGWLTPGEHGALTALKSFTESRLETYVTDRNFPHLQGQSDLSPYLHFGHISAQRAALEIQKSTADPASRKAFLEELVVRRELADNFCLYQPDYDYFKGFQPWARATLDKHRDDPREYLYTLDQFEHSLTHDRLWNAAQLEMVVSGKMHGYMRMYWAKKILEWTPSPEEAMAVSIYLNDKYELDGRDPNGYAGIAWAIGGTHDRPWGERPVFGMIRYMNLQGCIRKFDVEKYIQIVNRKSPASLPAGKS